MQQAIKGGQYRRVIRTLSFTAVAIASTTLAQARDVEVPASVIGAAKKEGMVTIYTGSPDFKQIVDAFSKKYGIRGVVVQLGGTENQQRFRAEADSKRIQADLFTTTDVDFLKDYTAYFRPLPGDTVPNAANFAPMWRTDNSVLWTSLPLGVSFNTKLVPASAAPKTWSDLLKPEYKGRLCLNDPRGGNGARGFTKTITTAHGPDYLKALAAQNIRIIPGNSSPGTQAVAAGDCPISFPQFSGITLTRLQAAGAPIDWRPLGGPVIQNLEMMALVKGSPHPNAALLLANFAIGEEATKLRCRTATVSMASDADGKLGCFTTPNPVRLDFATKAAEFNGYLDILGIK